jgi:hypothetical protein
MSEYGYIPEVAQSFGDNTGVFDPADINNLVADNKWTQYGHCKYKFIFRFYRFR